MTMKSKTRIAAAMALALSALGANAAITNSNANFGNSSALFVAMDSATSVSLVVDLGVSMADFVGVISGVNANAGSLSAANTVASWNFGSNTRTVNGVEVAGDYAWSSAVSSFFSMAQGGVVWGVIGADNVSGAASGSNTLTNRNLLTTGSPTDANIVQVSNALTVSNGVGAFQNFVGAQTGTGTHGSNNDGASTVTSGAAFLNTTMRGNFNNSLPWNYLSAVDTTSHLFLVNQQANPVVYQLGAEYGVDALLTEGMATFRYDSATNSLNFAAAMAPVPEPETYAMLVAGLAAVGAVVRRRSRKQQG